MKKYTVLLTLSLLAIANLYSSPEPATSASHALDLFQLFQDAPIVYSILVALSIGSFFVLFYSLYTIRASELTPKNFIHEIKKQLAHRNFDAAMSYCLHHPNMYAKIVATGISTRKHGHQVVVEAMQTEGKRCGTSLWGRISILSDIAMIAPMLGLLGTVLGLFYAFYDVNRSQQTIISIFDGLGIAIGTTVAGLIVAIMAMFFYTLLKYRLVRILHSLENETLSLTPLITS